MCCLSHSSYGMPGFAPLIYVLFWKRHIFHVSFSGRSMSGSVWNRPSVNSMVDMGIWSTIMKSPTSKCYMTFLDMIIYRDTLHWSDISLKRDLACYRTGPYYNFLRYNLILEGFYRTFETVGASQQRTLNPEDTWSFPIWDLHLFKYLHHSFINLSCLRTFWVSNIPRYFNFTWGRCNTSTTSSNLNTLSTHFWNRIWIMPVSFFLGVETFVIWLSQISSLFPMDHDDFGYWTSHQWS